MPRLLLAFLLLLSTPAWANTIALHTNISADNAISGVNSNFSTIANWANGNVEGSTDSGATVSNIKADSLYEINMADDANPRTRDSELFNITVDTISGGAVASQGTVVESGCVPATDTDLTSDVSACVAYINGYRVSKAATAVTYTDNTTTYLWISQTGNYTASTNPNSTIANSALLASVVTAGGDITTVTTLYTTRVPGLVTPAHYRTGLRISRDSTTTLTVFPGSAEINNSMINKTATTTLAIPTAGDYAGGVSLRAASTYGFVGMDTSGNLKLHTTAPTHDNYAVSTTAGKKRYATWSSTVYRILGWFYMDGAQLVENASNIKEGDVANTIVSVDTTTATFNYIVFTTIQGTNFYNSGGNILVINSVSGDSATGADVFANRLQRGGTTISGAGGSTATLQASGGAGISYSYLDVNRPQGTAVYTNQSRAGSEANTVTFNSRVMVIQEQ